MFTPGPWVVARIEAKDTEDGNADTVISAYADENGEEGATVASVNRWSYGDEPPTAESEANARLIAAAPDLLEACHKARALLAGSIAEADQHLVEAALREAIAKATREEAK